MDYTAFTEAQAYYPAQPQQQQYQSHQAYDPAQTQQVLYDAAVYYGYHPQHHRYGHHPSSAHHHSPYQPPPPPPPGADPAARPAAAVLYDPSSQIHSSRGQDLHHPATPQMQQRAPGGAAYPALQQFVATVGAPERAVAPPQHPRFGGESAHRGGGGRGCWPFRGGSGRGNFGCRPSKHVVGVSPFHGRRRGRKGGGRSRQNHQSAPDGQLPVIIPASVTKSLSVMEPMLEESHAPSQVPALVAQSPTVTPRFPFLPLAWCDICRVDCNSLEVLEQHKNGKRHKKTVQRIQEMQAQQKLMADLQAKYAAKPQMVLQSAEENKVPLLGEANKLFSLVGREKIASSGGIIAPAFPFDQVSEADKAVAMSRNMTPTGLSAQVSEANKSCTTSITVILSEVNEANIRSIASENLPLATMEMDHKMRSDAQSQTITMQSESSKEEKAGSEAPTSDAPDNIDVEAAEGHGRRPRMNGYDNRHGPKRKMMRYWRDGKRLKRLEAVGGRPQEHQKERPRVCTLCNVMCDTRAVFECHLSGKKHISRIKRFQGQHTVFGPITVYIPPNQPTAHPPQAPEPLFYGLKSHEMLQQEACMEHYGLQLSDQAKQGGEAEVADLGSQSRQHLEQPEGTVPTTEGQKLANMYTKG